MRGRELLGEGCGCGGAIEGLHVGQQHEATGALDQRSDSRAVGRALDEVALPVSGDETVGDFFRPDGYFDVIGD